MVPCSALSKLIVENVILNLEKDDEYKIWQKNFLFSSHHINDAELDVVQESVVCGHPPHLGPATWCVLIIHLCCMRGWPCHDVRLFQKELICIWIVPVIPSKAFKGNIGSLSFSSYCRVPFSWDFFKAGTHGGPELMRSFLVELTTGLR